MIDINKCYVFEDSEDILGNQFIGPLFYKDVDEKVLYRASKEALTLTGHPFRDQPILVPIKLEILCREKWEPHPVLVPSLNKNSRNVFPYYIFTVADRFAKILRLDLPGVFFSDYKVFLERAENAGVSIGRARTEDAYIVTDLPF
ncbi:MAG TPA: hypothetical protein VJI68_02645 [Candidatus Nanoarchaeia archaeon]|nr:hypothetical protein [Candidatus Nanoarchaeia archaeon]